MSVGRPTKYDPAYCTQVEKLCKLGATDKEIADFFDIAESTVNEWKLTYTEFSESIKTGKMLADAEVADKLFKRATGYSHEDVDIKMYDGDIITTPLIKHYPPDTAAAIFWLKNRQKKKWRDKMEQGFTDAEGNDVNIIKKIEVVHTNAVNET
jgi:hypothetical protein